MEEWEEWDDSPANEQDVTPKHANAVLSYDSPINAGSIGLLA